MKENVLVLSTAHITKSTDAMLNENYGRKSADFPRYHAHEFGFILFVAGIDGCSETLEEACEYAITHNMPEFAPIFKKAYEMNCAYIDIDRDAKINSSLEIFEW